MPGLPTRFQLTSITAAATRPGGIALCVVSAYLLLVTPILARHNFDPSVFIVAGDQFTNRAHTEAPIIVFPKAPGYDGQFYYAIAAHPFRFSTESAGVRFDSLGWRMQRILYPLAAHLLAFGNAARLPVILFLLNIAALFALIWQAARWAEQRGQGAVMPLAIASWPGLMNCVIHDTTEVIACTLLFGAATSYVSSTQPFDRRFRLFGLLIALAALTRETSALMLAGIVLWELIRVMRAPRPVEKSSLLALAFAAGASLPFVAWHLVLAFTPASGVGAVAAMNVGLPFAGALIRLYDAARSWLPSADVALRFRLLNLHHFGAELVVLGFCACCAFFAGRLLRQGGRPGGVAAGWFCIVGLMSTLSAQGPWIDAVGFSRSFSECWIIGWMVLTLCKATLPRVVWWAFAPFPVVNLAVAYIQLR